MNRKRKFITGVAIPFMLILLITGCKNSEEPKTASPAKEPEPAAAVSSVQEAPQTVSPKPAAEEKPPVKPGDKVTLSSADADHAQEEKPAEKTKPKPANRNFDISDSYTQSKPTLMGLALKTNAETVENKFGKPNDQYTMEDETDPITVYDYGQFSVGFNKQDQLEFVDIRSSDINPGLNGLKLGQTVDDAYKALGKPDSNTSYVLSYKAEGTVLKLDVDPKNGKINSIKLFPEK